MKKLFFITCLLPLFTFAQPTKLIIPLGGNAWATGTAAITDDGLIKWTSQKSIVNIYFRVPAAQEVSLSLRCKTAGGNSKIIVHCGQEVFLHKLTNSAFDTISIGKVQLEHPGYVKVSLQGLVTKGTTFAEVTDLVILAASPENEFTYVRKGSSFHFGRRGPSVHLRCAVPEAIKKEVKWFYSEINVPTKNDVIGSYFMADGFNGGYFGMQVNSATERRVLFSVWSPFNTDDPKSIPDSLRIKLLAKGAKVHGGEFGDEGSGGQSYLQYPWQAGKSYGFLLRAEPHIAHNSTAYTAWFRDVAANKWLLVASFSRPQTNAYLGGLYSFLENFEPENGDKVRAANYQNQWLADSSGKWYELTSVTYNYDATAKANYRKDYAGGAAGNKFFLKNGGFFNDLVPAGQTFTRAASGKAPVIDFKALPIQ